MATYDYAKGSGVGFPAGRQAGVFVVERLLDFALIAADRDAAGLTALAANDVIQAIHVPAFTHVVVVGAEVLTAEGEAGTIDVGDGTDVDGYVDGLDANVVGSSFSLVTVAYSLATAGGKVYTSADTIDVTLLTATYATGKIRIIAEMIDLRAVEGYGR